MNKLELLELRCKAKMGDGKALFELAWCHVWGIGCDVDIEKAYHLLKDSEKHGFSEAHESLEKFFDDTDGTIKLDKEFLEIYGGIKEIRLAAENGDAGAQYLFAFPRVTESDTSQYVKQSGVEWLKKSAAQEYAPALFLLGALYIEGKLVPQNKKEGGALIEKAAEKGEMKAINYMARVAPSHALPYIEDLSNQGNPKAQGMLGQMYLEGIAVEKNIEKGLELWRKAAEQGDTNAMFNLGMVYDFGKYGQAHDIHKAINWYEKGAEKDDVGCLGNLGYIFEQSTEIAQDHFRAFKLYSRVAERFEGNEIEGRFPMNNLGTCYKRGLGCKADPQKALECYLKSAENGCIEAMLNLFKFFTDEVSVPHDYAKAKEWLEKAADAGNVWAIMKIAEGHEKGILFEYSEEKAVRYYRLAADKGDPKALVMLGKRYLSGVGIERSIDKAKDCFSKAVEAQYVPAYHELGLFYCNHEHQDYVEAARWFSIGANAGYAPAEYELGVCYRHGHGLPADIQKAIYWMEKSAKQGNDMAQTNLGIYYKNGIGVERDIHKAVQLFTEAAETGNMQAQFCLGACYYNGTGVEQNYTEAVKWFERAAAQGEPDSMFQLARCYSEGLGVAKDFEKSIHYLKEAAQLGWKPAIEALKDSESDTDEKAVNQVNDCKQDDIPQSLTERIVRAWKDLDAELLGPILADDFQYNSVWVSNPLDGKEDYLSYLRGKFDTIRGTDAQPIVKVKEEYGRQLPHLIQRGLGAEAVLDFIEDNGRITKMLMRPAVNIRVVGEEEWDIYSQAYYDFLPTALQIAGNHIQEIVNNKEIKIGEFSWLQTHLVHPSFQHLCFRYGNEVYSILIGIHGFTTEGGKEDDSIILRKKDYDNLLNECRKHNLIPCIIPICARPQLPMLYNCLLINANTEEPIQLISDECKENVAMSEWEINSMGIDAVVHYLVKQGYEKVTYCDVVGIEPQVWFEKDGKKCYVIVRSIPVGYKNRTFEISHSLLMKFSDYYGFFADIQFSSSNPVLKDDKGNVVPLSKRDGEEDVWMWRGDGFYCNFAGLQEIEKAIVENSFIKVVDKETYDIE